MNVPKELDLITDVNLCQPLIAGKMDQESARYTASNATIPSVSTSAQPAWNYRAMKENTSLSRTMRSR
jgi:hypothetical protein